MADKVVVLLVEGETEVEFYKAIVKRAHDLMSTPFSCYIKYINVKGIGNYKNLALRKFEHLKTQYDPETEFILFLCIDSDVFQLSKKPPINKKEVRSALLAAGAKKVTYIVAKQSIEEWFLTDLSGVLKFLRLSKKTKRPNGNCQEAIIKLFSMANRVYVKGDKIEGFIKHLDIGKIMTAQCQSLSPLCKTIGFDCHIVCNKK